MSRMISEAFGYAFVSAIALGVDVTLLVFLVEIMGLDYLVAATCSFVAGAFTAYALSVKFVFRVRRVDDWRLELAAFVAIGVIGVGVNALVIFCAVERLQFSYIVGKFMAAAVTFTVNFLLRRWALFSSGACADASAGEKELA